MEIKKGIYRHYKGHIYRVLCMATHSEDLSPMVIYQDTTDASKIWARPAGMWNETVEKDGKTFRRFEWVGEE